MTIASSVSKTPTYACNGSTTTFPYEFKILTPADMTVILEDASGIQTTLTYPDDYTLTGVNTDEGGSISTALAYASGYKITGIRAPSFLQGVDLQNQGAFFSQVIEDALDLAAMRDQSLASRIGNAIRAPETETVSMVLPSATLRANRYLIFDANGQPTYVNSQIDARYYGSLGADPTTRLDGSACQAGDLYFNTVSLGFRNYSGFGWQAAIPPAALTLTNFTETVSSPKTIFTITGGYTIGTAFAYLNGVLLAPDEVTMSNGTTAVLASACAVGDEFRLVAYSPFSVADTLSKASNLSDLPSASQGRTNLGIWGHGSTTDTNNNLNTKTSGGVFYAASTATGLPLAEDTVYLHHPSSSSSRAIQEAFGLTSGRRFWRRETSSGVWQAWNEIPNGVTTIGIALAQAADKASARAAIGAAGGAPDALLEDQRASGTAYSSIPSGSFATRVLNTEVRDPLGIVSLASNQFTVTADCWCEASAPAVGTQAHQVRILNVTDGVVVRAGTSEQSNSTSATTSRSKVSCQLTAGKTYRLEHRVGTSQSGGTAAGFGELETYAQVKLWRL